MAKENVAFVLPQLKKLLPQYKLIDDAIEGETAIKDASIVYLPMPNASDTSAANKARYKAYLQRAVFYNATRRTLNGLIGQVFMRDAVINVPAQLEVTVADASGSGISLEQQIKSTLEYALAFSRAGLLVDYPQTEGGASVADLESGRIRPTISNYKPWHVVNWRVRDIGAETVLSLVVLLEAYTFDDDGFEVKTAAQFRVLRLTETNQYTVQIYRQAMPTAWDERKMPLGNFTAATEEITPLDASGTPFNEIPFTFIGSENNDSEPDSPSFYDLASLNLAHYRNSADYEESCYVVGQPTPVLIGLSEQWFKDVLGGVVAFGSTGGIPLPVGADAKLLQATENTMIKEAMETKERQMVALGAKLVEQQSVQRTAFETKVEMTAESSTLATVTKNVEAGYLAALQWCAQFVGADAGTIEVNLNTDFDVSSMTPEERSQVLKEWQAGALTFTEMRAALRKGGTATEDDEKAKGEIAQDTADAMALEAPLNQPGA